MDNKVRQALTHLQSVLPLKQKQDKCTKEIKQLHQNILRSFVTHGKILTRQQMAGQIDDIDEAVRVLGENDMVVFSDDGEPFGAYPFTMDAREHQVLVNGYQVNAMCALDALAVSPMFDIKAQIISTCRVTGKPINIQQSGLAIENLDEAGAVHFGIAWGASNTESCCADSLCMEMIYLVDGDIAQQWLDQDPEGREVFTLPEAVEFSARFFVPLMQ